MTNSTDAGITQRHWIAVTALISGMVAFYLHLWKLGLMGPLACTANHSCELVQMSDHGWFLGVDVALIGTVGYSLILVTSIVGLSPRFINDRRFTWALMGLIYPALLFTLRLKRYEFFVLKTFCIWCAVSAVTISAHSVLVWYDKKRLEIRD